MCKRTTVEARLRNAAFILQPSTFILLFLLSACRSTPKPAGPTRIPDNLAVRAQFPGRIVLTDNSPWQVQPAGQSASLFWQPGDSVAVVRSGHPAWPFLLTSLRARTTARARPFPQF